MTRAFMRNDILDARDRCIYAYELSAEQRFHCVVRTTRGLYYVVVPLFITGGKSIVGIFTVFRV